MFFQALWNFLSATRYAEEWLLHIMNIGITNIICYFKICESKHSIFNIAAMHSYYNSFGTLNSKRK
jgi:hypothetical protein